MLHTRELARGHGQKLPGVVAVITHHPEQRPALDDADDRIGDRLGREAVLLSLLEPEDVTGEVESADLAASIRQDLDGARRPMDDLVDVFDRLALAVDFAARAELDWHAQHRSRQYTGAIDCIVAHSVPLRSRHPLLSDLARVHVVLEEIRRDASARSVHIAKATLESTIPAECPAAWSRRWSKSLTFKNSFHGPQPRSAAGKPRSPPFQGFLPNPLRMPLHHARAATDHEAARFVLKSQ